ncbi:MAG TPA: class I SAM-dependent methyltransferase [Solirubrobacteraceae bacterium]|nr:class I SAM-dependent methyltransferase [Solirubrobacteraceae bacterium]
MEQQAYREQFELEGTHWWFSGRRAVIWALLRRAQTPQGVRMLDAGCGTGHNLIEYGRLGSATGVDFSADAIAFCRQRGLQGATQGRLEALEFPDGAFDLILATDVLEHLDDDLAAMRELRRVAAPGARLLVTVPAYQWLWSQHDTAHHHFRRYTLPLLRERLAATGWRTVVSTYFNSVLLPPIAAVRVIGRRNPDPAERPDLKLTPPLLNAVLERPMRAEARLIERGGQLPAGVSIGLVARADGAPAPARTGHEHGLEDG